MSIRRIFVAVTATLVLAGCGGSSETPSAIPSSTAPTSTPAATVPSVEESSSSAPTPTPSPTPTEVVGITGGLVVASCEARDDEDYVDVTQVDLVHGTHRTITFKWPSGHSGCDSEITRASFNDNFTRLFTSRKNPKGDGNQHIGYLSPESEGFPSSGESDSNFTLLSKKTGEFTDVDDRFPSFQMGNGRLYYCDKLGSNSKLISMTVDGQKVKAETGLQKTLRNGGCENLVMADTELPIAETTDDDRDVLYDRKGIVSISVTDRFDNEQRPSFTINKNGRKLTYKLDRTEFAARKLTFAGFLDDDSVAFTDTQRIYRADMSGKTARVTTVLDNTVEDKQIVSAKVSADKKRIAFAYGDSASDAQYALYVLTISDKTQTEPSVGLGSRPRVLQFN